MLAKRLKAWIYSFLLLHFWSQRTQLKLSTSCLISGIILLVAEGVFLLSCLLSLDVNLERCNSSSSSLELSRVMDRISARACSRFACLEELDGLDLVSEAGLVWKDLMCCPRFSCGCALCSWFCLGHWWPFKLCCSIVTNGHSSQRKMAGFDRLKTGSILNYTSLLFSSNLNHLSCGQNYSLSKINYYKSWVCQKFLNS